MISSDHISIIGNRSYPPDFIGTSGVERYTFEIVERLLKLNSNFFITIYIKHGYSSKATLPKINNNRLVLKSILSPKGKFSESIWYSFVSSVSAALSDSSTVWYHGIGCSSFCFIPWLARKRILITVHSQDWKRTKWPYWGRAIFHLVAKIIFLLPFTFIAVSKKLSSLLLQHHNVRCRVASPGVDFLHIKSGESSDQSQININLKGKKYLLFLGRIVPEKRLEWLIQALYELSISDTSCEVDLAVVGKNGNTPSYEINMRKLAMCNSRIHWLPSMFGRRKTDIIRNAHALIIPSSVEGNPLVAWEATALGTSCLLSSDFYDQRLGSSHLVFDRDSYHSFKNQLMKIILAPKRHVRAKSENGWRKSAQLYYNLLRAS